MRSCWNEKPEDRPSFLQLRKTMKEMGDEREVKKSSIKIMLNVLSTMNMKQTLPRTGFNC